MPYTKHNYQKGDELLASQLNDMDDQIALNEQTADTLVTVSNTQPLEEKNRVWVKATPSEIEIPTMEDVDELNRQISDVEESQTRQIGRSIGANVTPIAMINGGFIALDKATVDVNNPTSSDVYRYAVIPCVAGDRFIINATGRVTAKPWGFVAADGTKLVTAKADSATSDSVTKNGAIMAPENSAYLVINDRNSGVESYAGYSSNYTLSSGAAVELISGDLNDLTTYGNYFFLDNNIDNIANLPDFNGQQLSSRITVEYSIDIYHILQKVQSSAGMYYAWRTGSRNASGVTRWTDWYIGTAAYQTYNLTSAFSTVIPDEADLDDYISVGNYRINSAVTAATILNAPLFNDQYLGGRLFVENALGTNSNAKRQIYKAGSGTAIAMRYFDGNTWGKWRVDYNYNKVPENPTIYDGYIINSNTGAINEQAPTWYSLSDWIDVSHNKSRKLYTSAKIVVAEYSTNGINGFIGRQTIDHPGFFELVEDTNYIRISTQYITPIEELYIGDTNDSLLKGLEINIDTLYSAPATPGMANFIAKANQFMNVEWTPLNPIPVITGDKKYTVVYPGTTCKGLPYSSLRAVRKYVGTDISLYTYMSAINNPKSVLYSRIIKDGTLGATYYGTVCTTYPVYALGISSEKTDYCWRWPRSQTFVDELNTTEISKYEIQPGDLFVAWRDMETSTSGASHVIMIYRVTKDRYGRINSFTTVEGIFPLVGKETVYAFDSIDTLLNTYKLYRPNFLGANGYVKFPFVQGFPDETLEEVVWPDIMTEFGDKICVPAGSNIRINVIDAKTYNAIQVYKDDSLQQTISEIADFTLSNVAYGKYRIVITDGTNSSETSFIAADMQCNYDSINHIVTFSSANATPLGFDSYGDSTTNPGNTGVANRGRNFTDAELQAGQADATALVGTKCPFINVTFYTEYGTEVWWSNPVVEEMWESWTEAGKNNVTNRTYEAKDIGIS